MLYLTISSRELNFVQNGELIEETLELEIGRIFKGDKGDKGDTGSQGPQGETGPAGQDGESAGFGTPTATIDGNTGTPGVTVTASGPDTAKIFSFAFTNLKGDTGAAGADGAPGRDGTNGTDGADGQAAGFGTPTATIDSNTGTPGVTVTASGPDTAKVFAFAFTNLKGDTGATGETGPAGADGHDGTNGVGVPAGGTTGQVLAKKSNADYDTEWKTEGGKVGIVSQTQKWSGGSSTGYTYEMQNPQTGPIHDYYIDSATLWGGTFNETSGYFEMNNLTDISLNEMKKILQAAMSSVNYSGGYVSATIRNLPFNVRTMPKYHNYGTVTHSYAYFQVEFLETMNFDGTTNNLSNAYRGCTRLREIIITSFTGTAANTIERAFENCYSLQKVHIGNIRIGISFPNSPNLAAESVAYMINNSYTSAGNFTITLHATAYARATADANVQTALSNHTNVTLASA